MMEKCEHCGVEADEDEIDIYHRSCRLKAAFPGAYTEAGGIVSFDVPKITEAIEMKELKGFVTAVKAMRDSQQAYFRNRRREDLAESKRLEKKVDLVLMRLKRELPND